MVEGMECTQLIDEQLTRLMHVKTYGEYRTTRCSEINIRTHSETLYQVLYEYCKLKDIRYFKSRHYKMRDLPLTTGELINAIKYGVNNGFLVNMDDRNSKTWGFNVQ